ncbi:MAG: DUF4405 domain-containing protein [Sphingobacterium hotanense]
MKLSRNYITPFISLTFLVVGVSGVLMYFHLFDGYTEILHELLGLFFLICAVLHILLNWKALRIHFNRGVIMPAGIAIVVLSVLIISQQQFHPKVDTVLLDRLVKAPIEDVFKALAVDSAEALVKLNAHGISADGAECLEEIWKNNNAEPEEVFDLILQ